MVWVRGPAGGVGPKIWEGGSSGRSSFLQNRRVVRARRVGELARSPGSRRPGAAIAADSSNPPGARVRGPGEEELPRLDADALRRSGSHRAGPGSELGLDLPGRMATVQGSEIETGARTRPRPPELEAIRIFPFPGLLLMYQAIFSDTS